jgi:hypothetical protein
MLFISVGGELVVETPAGGMLVTGAFPKGAFVAGTGNGMFVKSYCRNQD